MCRIRGADQFKPMSSEDETYFVQRRRSPTGQREKKRVEKPVGVEEHLLFEPEIAPKGMVKTAPTTTGWSRRRFLTLASSSIFALAAAACGRDPATPTPTRAPGPTATATPVARSSLLPTPKGAYKSYLPQVASESVALAPTPTVTPANTPTPTTPPPTPTPVATPFPPGPPSKLGLHVERNLPDLFELLETKAMPVVTTLELDANFAKQIKETSPKTVLIGRRKIGDAHLEQLTDPRGAARGFVDALLPYADDARRRPYFDGWIGYNEPVINNADDMKRLAEFEAERVRLLGDRGIRSVIGNFATGNPGELSYWAHFLPAVQAAKEYNGWLGLHEYSAPTIYYLTEPEKDGRYPGVSASDTGWLTLRYRKVYNQYLKPANLAIPLIFTECGIDGLVQAGRPGPKDARGWRDFQSYWAENGFGLWGPGAYIEQLVWFDEAMRQDSYVVGGCIYGLGTSAEWLAYELQGPAAAVLKQYLSVHTSG